MSLCIQSLNNQSKVYVWYAVKLWVKHSDTKCTVTVHAKHKQKEVCSSVAYTFKVLEICLNLSVCMQFHCNYWLIYLEISYSLQPDRFLILRYSTIYQLILFIDCKFLHMTFVHANRQL